MQRFFCFILTLFIPFVLLASTGIPTIAEIEAKIPLEDKSKGLKWSNGVILGDGSVANGQRHGLWIYSFKDNHDTAVKLYEGRYQYGIKTGEWKCYNQEGRLIAKDNYINGQLSGACITYYPSGQVRIHATYSKNMRNGRYMEYYEDGKPIEISWYTNGKQDGQVNRYYPNGKKQLIGKYKLGEKMGKWIFYNDDNTIESQGNYTNGEKTGTWTYFQDGIAKTEQY